MIPGNKILLPLLVDQAGRSYWVDYSGVRPLLKVQQSPRPLKHAPEGWQETEIKFGRNMKFFGLDRTFTNQYKFVKDGAFIIRSMLYANKGIESKLYFIILRWNHANGVHEMFFKAEVDLSNCEDDPLTGVTVNLIDGGPGKLIKANEGVPYEIPCNASNPAARVITNDGVRLRAGYNYSLLDVEITGSVNTNTADTIVIPMAFLNREGNSVGIVQGSPSYDMVTDFVTITPQWATDVLNYCQTSNNYFIYSIYGITQEIEATISISNTGSADKSFRPMLYTSEGQHIWFTSVLVPAGGTQVIPISATVTLAAEEKIYLMGYMGTTGSYTLNFNQTNFKTSFDSRNDVSLNYGVSAYDLWKQLVLKFTDGRYTGESTLLQQYPDLMLTCGDALRGIDTAMIKTSLNDFADKSFIKLLNGAVGINYATYEIVFEKKEFFFDNTYQIIDLGEVADFGISIAKEFIWNQVKVGWPVKDATDSLGKQEFNDLKNFTFPITRTSAILDLQMFYRSDIFAIEQIRTDYFNKDNTATEKDNDVFMINCMQDGDNLVPLRVPYTSITGGDHVDTWYNIELLTPKRMLLNNKSYLSIPLYAQQTEDIKFQSGTRNDNLSTTYQGVTITEKADLQVIDLGTPFAYPFYFKFKTKVPKNFIPLLQANKGYISFSVNGIQLHGFPMDLSQVPVYDEPQEWKLLCSSLTDLKNLISLNDILTIGQSMISHKLPLKFVPLNAVYSEQYHFRHMDSDWHKNRIIRYSQKKPFGQKWQTNDNTPLQFISNGASMNPLQVINCKGVVKGTVNPTQISNPAVLLPFQLWHATVDWSIFAPNETYYVKISFGTGGDMKEFISEPVHLKTRWEETLFIKYRHDVNQMDMIFNAPYTGQIRIEGMIQKFEPKADISSYEDQTRDLEILNGEPYRQWQLLIGAQYGTPDWLIDKLNRILILNDITIDGHAYSIDKDAKLELIEVAGSPYAFYTINIRERNNTAGLDIDAIGINEAELTVQYNIDTVGFSSDQNPNVNNQNNIVQVIDVE